MPKLRAKFKKDARLKYIGHLDLIRLFQRTFRKANIPVEYSQGYNPHPKFSLATALALGIPSDGEYMDIELTDNMDIDDFITNMNNSLPRGVKILDADYTNDKKSLMALIKWSSYIIELFMMEEISKEEVNNKIENILSKDEILMTKTKKKRGKIRTREVNIRENIYNIDLLIKEDNRIVLKTLLKTGSSGNLKPEDLVKSLHKEGLNILENEFNIQRLELFTEYNGKITKPL